MTSKSQQGQKLDQKGRIGKRGQKTPRFQGPNVPSSPNGTSRLKRNDHSSIEKYLHMGIALILQVSEIKRRMVKEDMMLSLRLVLFD